MMKHSTFLIYTVYTICVVCVLLTCLIFEHIDGFWICELKCISMYVNETCYSGMLCSVD